MSSVDYLLEQNATRPVEVKKVELSGDSESFREGFFQTQLDPLFQESTLSGLLSRLQTTVNRLKAFGVHKSIAVKLDLDKGIDDNNEKLDLKAILSVEQADAHWLKVSSITRQDEAGLILSSGINNLFGGAESISIDALFNTRPRDVSSYAVNFATPVLGSPFTKAIISGKVSSQTLPWASHSQVIKGFSGRLVNNSVCSKANAPITREVGFEAVNRSVVGVGAAASDIIRASSGDNLKVSVSGSASIDSRDSIYYPTKGFSAAVTGEVAGSILGLPGDVSFIKTSLLASTAYSLDPINDRIVLNFSAGSGILHGEKTTILDRFYLGGAKDIYGFQYNGLGPKDEGDIIGGHGFAIGNISAYAKLPRLANDSPLRAIFLFNGASLVAAPTSEGATSPLKSLVQNIFSNPSTGAGVGLTYRSPNAQVELIYSVPLSTNSHDLTYRGLQFGVGLAF
ncbi:SAM complex subunit SAM50 [Sugiyamaella lignohabitans]|uniref:SAM complex subunit SAM50 n=1 Tax=Sugiyamaella lignohabitans TaxID=796027 RepID=A0A167DEZ1_9ASCO|nr:SAM complex subunit SAM50 [Sugiyamaella lignohabitans]ANB12840.1 SAM complex subunit SAM50 [Sugiyamaella lignohabitans]